MHVETTIIGIWNQHEWAGREWVQATVTHLVRVLMTIFLLSVFTFYSCTYLYPLLHDEFVCAKMNLSQFICPKIKCAWAVVINVITYFWLIIACPLKHPPINICYFGLIISAEGIRFDSDKLKAIREDLSTTCPSTVMHLVTPLLGASITERPPHQEAPLI